MQPATLTAGVTGPWGSNVSYAWSQAAGTAQGSFADANAATPVFTMPVFGSTTLIRIELTVTGKGGSGHSASALAELDVNGRPYATSGEVTSRPRTTTGSNANTYGKDERIEITLTYSEPMVVTGTPHIRIRPGVGRLGQPERAVRPQCEPDAARVLLHGRVERPCQRRVHGAVGQHRRRQQRGDRERLRRRGVQHPAHDRRPEARRRRRLHRAEGRDLRAQRADRPGADRDGEGERQRGRELRGRDGGAPRGADGDADGRGRRDRAGGSRGARQPDRARPLRRRPGGAAGRGLRPAGAAGDAAARRQRPRGAAGRDLRDADGARRPQVRGQPRLVAIRAGGAGGERGGRGDGRADAAPRRHRERHRALGRERDLDPGSGWTRRATPRPPPGSRARIPRGRASRCRTT